MASIVLRFHLNRLFPKWYILRNKFQAQLIKLGLFQKFEQYSPYPLHYKQIFIIYLNSLAFSSQISLIIFKCFLKW